MKLKLLKYGIVACFLFCLILPNQSSAASDKVKPIISGAGNKILFIGNSFNSMSGVTAKDNIDGIVTKNIKVSGTVNTKKAGSYKLTYMVSDKAKNKTIVIRTITVKKDTVKPTISGAINNTIYIGNSFSALAGVTAKDNADGNITKSIKVSGSVNIKKRGNYKLTYTVSDRAKNKATVTRTITVKKDSIKPSISGAANKTISLGTSFSTMAGVTAKDNVDGNITKSIKVSGSINLKKAGVYKITYTVSDKAKNTSVVTRIITVLDKIRPEISGIQDTQIYLGNNFNALAGVSASDNNDGNLTSTIKAVGSVDVNKAGIYVLTYSVTDKSGNTSSVQRKVTVIDNIKPVITGTQDKQINFNEAFDPLAGVSASDNNDGDLTSSIKVAGSVSINKAGIYMLTYSVTDKSGNTSSVQRKVTVIDNIKPVITGTQDKQINFNDAFNPLAGVSASDNNDGDLTSAIKVTGSVNVNGVGIYVLTYSVTDKSGNTSSAERKVTVIDNVKPVITGTQDKQINFNDAFNPLAGVSASDNNDGDLTSAIKVTGSVNINKAGIYVLTYSVTDKSGNTSSAQRKITVIDNIKPVITGTQDKQINFNDAFDPLAGVTASDNNDGDLTSAIKIEGLVDVNKAGSYTLTYSVTDKSGNAVSAERKVTVIDHIKPAFSGAEDITIGLNTEFDLLAGVSASDNNDGDLTPAISTNGSVNTTVEGNYTVTYSVSDRAGNTSEISRIITVKKIKVSSLEINMPSSMKTGVSRQLTVTFNPSNATDQALSWSSSDESVAIIDKNGLVTSVSEGTVTITATADGISTSKTLIVSDQPNLYLNAYGSVIINNVIRSMEIDILNYEYQEKAYVEKIEIYEGNSLFTSYSKESLQNSGISTTINPRSNWGINISFKLGIWKNGSKVIVTVRNEKGNLYTYSKML